MKRPSVPRSGSPPAALGDGDADGDADGLPDGDSVAPVVGLAEGLPLAAGAEGDEVSWEVGAGVVVPQAATSRASATETAPSRRVEIMSGG